MKSNPTDLDAVIVGAGAAGLYMLHRLRGMGLRARVLEAGGGVGGTWYWNRYPGARCDVPSLEYSFGFSDELQEEWEWTETMPAQPEVLRYLEHVAQRFDLYRDIQFGTRVSAAHFDTAAKRWAVKTEADECFSARFCIPAKLSSGLILGSLGLSAMAPMPFARYSFPRSAIRASQRFT